MSADTNTVKIESETTYLEEVDLALEQDKAEAKKRIAEAKKEKDQESNLRSLPVILRFIGALVVLASAATFMVQNWETSDHILRYFSFLGFTAALTFAGFLCGIKIKEDKGARTLLAISAAIIPVHFCQLGALVYSIIPSEWQEVVTYPSFLVWKGSDPAIVFASLAIALVVLAPVTLIAFSALIRAESKKFCYAYLLVNAALLIPVRNPDIVAWIGVGLVALVTMIELRYLKGNAVMKTKEGLLCRLMIWVPPLVLFARNACLYELTALFWSAFVGAVGLVCYVAAPYYLKQKEHASFVQYASTIPISIAWFILADSVVTQTGMAFSYQIPFFYLPLAAIYFLMSFGSIANASGYQKLAAFVAMSSVFCNLLEYPDVLSSTLCISVAIVTIAYSYIVEQKLTLIIGVVGFIAGLLYHVRFAIDLFHYNQWATLAVIGVLTILASSYIEKNHRSLISQAKELRSKLEKWN